MAIYVDLRKSLYGTILDPIDPKPHTPKEMLTEVSKSLDNIYPWLDMEGAVSDYITYLEYVFDRNDPGVYLTNGGMTAVVHRTEEENALPIALSEAIRNTPIVKMLRGRRDDRDGDLTEKLDVLIGKMDDKELLALARGYVGPVCTRRQLCEAYDMAYQIKKGGNWGYFIPYRQKTPLEG